jgi:hypothetical protein
VPWITGMRDMWNKVRSLSVMLPWKTLRTVGYCTSEVEKTVPSYTECGEDGP